MEMAGTDGLRSGKTGTLTLNKTTATRVVSAPAAHHAVHGQHRPATAAAAGARGRVAGAAVKGLPQV